jgi:hypothetical protein
MHPNGPFKMITSKKPIKMVNFLSNKTDLVGENTLIEQIPEHFSHSDRIAHSAKMEKVEKSGVILIDHQSNLTPD